MSLLKINCKSLDNLLGGGFESGIITKIYGEAGTGKTNIGLQLSRECVIAQNKVTYLDTEGVSIERLKQICSNRYDCKKILDKILIFKPSSFYNQEKMIHDIIKMNDIGLIVVDTINMFYRVDLETDIEKAKRSFTRQVTNLQIAARKKDLYVIINEQVYTDKSGTIKPFTNRDTEHMVKTIIKLEKIGINKRQATLIKHRSQSEEKKTFFNITNTGLE
jgi:DNA repair protein RadB